MRCKVKGQQHARGLLDVVECISYAIEEALVVFNVPLDFKCAQFQADRCWRCIGRACALNLDIFVSRLDVSLGVVPVDKPAEALVPSSCRQGTPELFPTIISFSCYQFILFQRYLLLKK